MLLTDSKVYTSKRIVHITDNGSEPLTIPYFISISSSSGNCGTVNMPTSLEGPQTTKTVRNDNTWGMETLFSL